MRSLLRPALALMGAMAVVGVSVGPASAAWPSASPAGLAQASATSSSVAMTWSSVAKAPRYRLQISTSSSMSNATYQRSTDTADDVTGLQPGRGYYVKVRVITTDGVNRSAYSDAVRAWTSFSVPTKLASTKRDKTSITFDWADVPNAPKYRIQLADNAAMSGATYHRFTGSEGTVGGLEDGTTYFAKVRVITPDGVNLSSYSPAVSVASGTTTPPADDGKGVPMTVASYNIRCANCYTGQNLEQPWSSRRGVVVASILKHKPDVIGIQEASQGWLVSGGKKLDLSQFEDLRSRLRSGGTAYEITNAFRNNCVKSTTPNSCKYQDRGASKGTRVFFNTATVKLISQGSKKLPQCSGCNERYVSWAVLEQKSSGQRFFFADTHIEYGSTYYDLRKSQTKAMMTEIAKRNADHLPAFVVGDFNSTRYQTPTNAPYDEVVAGGFIDPLGQTYGSPKVSSKATAEKRIRANYDSHNSFLRTPGKFKDNENGSNLDYIFTTRMRTLSWETVLDLDSNDKLVGTIPSDHNMVVAKVLLP